MKTRFAALACLLTLVAVAARPVTAAEKKPVAAPAKPAPASPPTAPFPYLWAKAFHLPPETTTDESGYFALCEGTDGKVYVGCAAYGRNAYLVEFDPATEKMRIVIDAHKVLGLPLTPTGMAAQAKIHTRCFVGPSGKIYVGTKQGYPTEFDKKSPTPIEYPGGYVMIYDPKTEKIENLGMPYPKQGVIDVVADEGRGLIYAVTCEDQHWMLYDTKAPEKQWRELGPMLFSYAATLVDAKGRANVITKDYSLARYDPATDKVAVMPMTLGGKPFIPEARPSIAQGSWIPTWNLAADGKTAYLVLMQHADLFRIDLGGDESAGAAIKVTDLGTLVQGTGPDTRSSLTIAPDGGVYVTVRVNNTTGFGGGMLHHIARYDPKTNTIKDLGVMAVKNPGFYGFPLTTNGAVDPSGAKHPWTHGYHLLPDGVLTPLHAHMALIAAHDGTLYATILYPYTLLKFDPVKPK